MLGPSVPSESHWTDGSYNGTIEFAAAFAFVVSVPLMLLVRSMIITTSTGDVGASPHGPLHAAEVTTPVDP